MSDDRPLQVGDRVAGSTQCGIVLDVFGSFAEVMHGHKGRRRSTVELVQLRRLPATASLPALGDARREASASVFAGLADDYAFAVGQAGNLSGAEIELE